MSLLSDHLLNELD